ncbi:MAG TPA: glycosyltransferase family 39 protein, partial [Candidatus Saccharimonadales bacterium]|nr:glycosyltransferase family 39 protein [Candidatus Saccharimonadales bacterium]
MKKLVENILLVSTLLLSGIIHGYNMLAYPYFENDEGVYLSQAWSFLSSGKLSPYTYWYDHAPVGWIFTSVWIFVTHGLFTFGFALHSARIFMLIIHVATTFLLFKIARKLTDSPFGAVIACLFFILSPLGIYFQRRLLLDNIMTFWLFLSIYLILYAKQRLLIILLSAVTFGIAVLSKENAVFFLPFLVWLVSRELHSKQIIFGVIQWIFIAGAIISLYPLYALLKTELFPTGTLLGGTAPHVSLLGSLQFQSSRGTGLPFWNPRSDFGYNFLYWMNTDRLIMLLGSACFVIQGIFAFFHKKSRIVFLLTLPMFLFLASGKLVINFYVIPLIPLLGLCIAQTVMLFIKLMKRLHISIAILFGVVIIVSVIGYYVQNTRFKGTLTINET